MEKVLAAKYASSYHFSDAMTRKAMRLTRTEVTAYSEAVDRSCAEEIDERKKKFIFEFEARLGWLPADWLSLEYRQHAENTAAQYGHLKKVALLYYTNQFKRFCLSQEIQDIREKVFNEGRHADHAYFQNLVINFVSEKLDSGKFDASPFTTDMRSLRERSLPNAKNHQAS